MNVVHIDVFRQITTDTNWNKGYRVFVYINRPPALVSTGSVPVALVTSTGDYRE